MRRRSGVALQSAMKTVLDLPRDNDKLDELWLQATCPSVDDFQGRELKVTMLTGPLPDLSWAGHKKVFYAKLGLICGHNVTFGFTWGHFFLQVQVNEVDQKDMLIINYAVPENGEIAKKIVDYARWLEEYDLYLGRFNYGDTRESLEFVGYFTLSKCGAVG